MSVRSLQLLSRVLCLLTSFVSSANSQSATVSALASPVDIILVPPDGSTFMSPLRVAELTGTSVVVLDPFNATPVFRFRKAPDGKWVSLGNLSGSSTRANVAAIASSGGDTFWILGRSATKLSFEGALLRQLALPAGLRANAAAESRDRLLISVTGVAQSGTSIAFVSVDTLLRERAQLVAMEGVGEQNFLTNWRSVSALPQGGFLAMPQNRSVAEFRSEHGVFQSSRGLDTTGHPGWDRWMPRTDERPAQERVVDTFTDDEGRLWVLRIVPRRIGNEGRGVTQHAPMRERPDNYQGLASQIEVFVGRSTKPARTQYVDAVFSTFTGRGHVAETLFARGEVTSIRLWKLNNP